LTTHHIILSIFQLSVLNAQSHVDGNDMVSDSTIISLHTALLCCIFCNSSFVNAFSSLISNSADPWGQKLWCLWV